MVETKLVSLWQDTTDDRLVEHGALNENISCDIAIIGAGYSGLWSAYYLKKMFPNKHIVVLEQHHVGFGASGRNGGWCSGFLPVSLDEIEKQHGRRAAVEMYTQSFRTLDEIQNFTVENSIDCDFHRGGTIQGATNSVQLERLKQEIDKMRQFGFGDEHIRNLEPDELKSRINLEGLVGATFTPHCAVIHPAKLVNGLARVVTELGVQIYENTRVVNYSSRTIHTERFICSADIVVRSTEGYTAQLSGHRRTLAPLYSYMVATSPLSEPQLNRLGWSNRETYHDARNMIIYAQITKDKRIAFGGRGAPYHFASKVKPKYDIHAAIHEKIAAAMQSVFGLKNEVEITHRWGGPLGLPRNWRPSVDFNAESGLASLGGYVGDGVAATNLAARTLAHLIANDGHPLAQLPWANHPSRKWEVEPLRYFGINGLLRLSESIDKYETKKNSPDKFRSFILNKLIGD